MNAKIKGFWGNNVDRAVYENFGASARYDPETRSIVTTGGDKRTLATGVAWGESGFSCNTGEGTQHHSMKGRLPITDIDTGRSRFRIWEE